MNILSKQELPYNYNNSLIKLFCNNTSYIIDANELSDLYEFDFFYKGGIHSGRLISVLLKLPNTNYALLDRALSILKKYSITIDDKIFFPYNFDFKIHGNGELLKSGWVSGLCQVMALSLYSRYFGDCNETRMILNSLMDDTILTIHDSGYFFNEYLGKCDALNGHIYVLYGLYDYWLISKSNITFSMLQAGIDWVLNNWENYRNENGASFYCIMHKKTCHKEDGKYHALHISQMNFLYKITGNQRFKDIANILIDDFKPKREIKNW